MTSNKDNVPHLDDETLLTILEAASGVDPDTASGEFLDELDAVKEEIRQRMAMPKPPTVKATAFQVTVSLAPDDWHTLQGLTDIARVVEPRMNADDFASGVLSNALDDYYRRKMPSITDYGRNLEGNL